MLNQLLNTTYLLILALFICSIFAQAYELNSATASSSYSDVEEWKVMHWLNVSKTKAKEQADASNPEIKNII